MEQATHRIVSSGLNADEQGSLISHIAVTPNLIIAINALPEPIDVIILRRFIPQGTHAIYVFLPLIYPHTNIIFSYLCMVSLWL